MRKLRKLNIRDVKHLEKHLHSSVKELENISKNSKCYYKEWDKDTGGKVRHFAEPKGRLREILVQLKYLLQRIELPEMLHGGIKWHSTRSNAEPHCHQNAVLKFDIKDFFPSIYPHMVRQLFEERLGCTIKVSKILTRLVTLDGGIPQGSPTSTVIANLVIAKLAIRINRLSDIHNFKYTQFVDDGTGLTP